ncbi:MAG: hypothetical protein NTY19_01545, partial [Planctomycetota bacterium]|nr:hypothetical protein [Planctomycetota bacterium]
VCAAGTYANGQLLRSDNAADARSAADLLLHPLIEAAVFETPEAGVVRDGLGFDRCQVVVMAEGGPAETAANFPSSASQDELAAARQALLGTLDSDGAVVVVAESAWASALPTSCAGEVLLFAEQPTHLAVRAQRARGGKAVFIRGTSVIASHGDQEELLADLASTDLHGSAIWSGVLAAVAAAWALHISPPTIQSGLNSFVLNPG